MNLKHKFYQAIKLYFACDFHQHFTNDSWTCI